MLRKWIQPVRKFCQINEEASVIQELVKKAEMFQDKKSDWKSVLASREWAVAPIVEVNGRMPMAYWKRSTKSGAKNVSEDITLKHAVVKIRWNGMENRIVKVSYPIDVRYLPQKQVNWTRGVPERLPELPFYSPTDLNILLGDDNTMYSVEVKAVMYGILSAIHWNEKKIRMKSNNEIVVKVANDKFKASKETTMFECIKKYIASNANKKNTRLLVKLDKMNPTDGQAVQNANVLTISESEFFKNYRESIDKMKSDF